MKARLPQGYGKQSQQQLMQQVQQMQENMRLKQEELENTGVQRHLGRRHGRTEDDGQTSGDRAENQPGRC